MRFHHIQAVICLFALAFTGCGGSGGDKAPAGNLTGTWSMTLTPTARELELDPQAEPSTIEIAFLQDGNRLIAEDSAYRIEGSISGTDIELTVLQAEEDGEEADDVARLDLQLTGNDQMTGTGENYAPVKDGEVDSPEKPHETSVRPEGTVEFIVDARRVASSAVNRDYSQTARSIGSEVCDILGSLASFAISEASDDSINPMGGCWLQKDGGGYYLFGRQGPGSIVPFWTQTVYYPYEFRFCGSRTYKFTMSIGNENLGMDQLLSIIQGSVSLASALHVPAADALSLQIQDFHNKYGGFAISYAYNTNSQNASIYVNIASGVSTERILDEPLVQTVLRAVRGINGVHNVDVFAGASIHDTWRLRRDPGALLTHCSTPLVIFYLFGTHSVTYD